LTYKDFESVILGITISSKVFQTPIFSTDFSTKAFIYQYLTFGGREKLSPDQLNYLGEKFISGYFYLILYKKHEKK
jgi:hypothetical protein